MCIISVVFGAHTTKHQKENKMKRRVVAAVAVILVSMWALSGCNTVKGVGEDVQSGGRAVERSSGK